MPEKVSKGDEEWQRILTPEQYEITKVPKAVAIKETQGKVKIAIDPETEAIAGVYIVAPLAADLIHEETLAVKFKLTTGDIVEPVHLFPTMSEAIKRVAPIVQAGHFQDELLC